MFPKHSRATKHLLSVYTHRIKKDFEDIKLECLRNTSAEYIDFSWGTLRPAVRIDPKDTVA